MPNIKKYTTSYIKQKIYYILTAHMSGFLKKWNKNILKKETVLCKSMILIKYQK